jgi:hypothetical protein
VGASVASCDPQATKRARVRTNKIAIKVFFIFFSPEIGFYLNKSEWEVRSICYNQGINFSFLGFMRAFGIERLITMPSAQ